MRAHEGPDLDLCLRPDAGRAPVGAGRSQALDQSAIAGSEEAEAVFAHARLAEELFDVGEKCAHDDEDTRICVNGKSRKIVITPLRAPCYAIPMIEGWQKRLIAAIEAFQARTGTSDYAISKEAELGQNFVGQLKKGRAAPKLDALQKLADMVGVSLMQVLFGADVTQEEEKLLSLYRQIEGEEDRKAYLQIVRGMSQKRESQSPASDRQEIAPGKE